MNYTNKFFKIIIFAIVALILSVTVFLFFNKNKTEIFNSSNLTIQDKIYVASEGAGQIDVVSMKDNAVIDKIDIYSEAHGMKIPLMPHNVQVAPDNKTVWVTANFMNMGGGADTMDGMIMSDEIIVIDPLSDEIIKRIEMGVGLHLAHIVLTPDSKYAIAIAQTKGVVYKIDTNTYEIIAKINTREGDEPHGLRISPDGKTAYIAILLGKSLGILDIEKMSLSYVPLKGAAVQSAVTSDGKYVLLSLFDAKSLAVYDIVAQKIEYIDLPVNAKGPVQIYITSDSRYVYLADQGYYFNRYIGNMVYKIDLLEKKITQTIKSGTAPHGVAISSDDKVVYVTNLLSDDLSVIDVALGKVVKKIKVGRMPNGISLFYK